MVSKQIILIVFKLLNFAVLIGLFWWLWRRYGRSYMLEELNEQIQRQDGLQRTHTVLQQEKKLIAHSYHTEQQEREQLKERLSSWRDALERTRSEREQWRRERQEQLKERIAKQLHTVEQYQLYHQLYAQAIQDARMKLEKQYETANAQKQFMASMVKRLD